MNPRQFGAFVLTTIAVMLAAMLLVIAGAADAATFNVNSTADAVDASPGNGVCETAPGNKVCTLRAAVQESNATSGANTIIVPAGTYTLTLRGAGEDVAATGDLDITNSVTITGAGAATTIVEACRVIPPGSTCGADDRIFQIDPFGAGLDVVISGLMIRNGAPGGFGGGVLNSTPRGGRLTLVDCVVANNSTGGDGGGIFNGSGTLTLIRTSVTGNLAADVGGGISDGDFGVINLSDSTVSGNTAALYGGGIFEGYFENGGVFTSLNMTNSTVSNNRALSNGGGIFVNRGTLNLTNSTVSNNSSVGGAGGIWLNDDIHPHTLNNSTIAANTSGSVGGLIGAVAASNTIVAGNLVNGSPSDCFGPFRSGGHNLIQAPLLGCAIVGDTTGNIIGQDPKLGVLADNGGPTKTHALIAGSPAIDAGNPGVPGSGGAACTLSDQRGLLRPHGIACDIGAFERVTEFSVSGIVPDGGANAGPAIVRISGNGFAAGAAAALRRLGQPDIVGAPVVVEAGSSEIGAVFDLTGKATGVWDVVVTNPDGRSATLPREFVIDQQPVPPALWASFSGRQAIRAGTVSELTIFFGNLGNTDALGVPLSLSIPRAFTGALLFRITPPPPQANQVATDWTQVPIDTLTPTAGYYNFNLFLPVIPAGYIGALQFEIASGPAEHGSTFTFLVSLGLPVFSPALEPDVVSGATAGAQAYAQKNLGVTIPPTLTARMNQYVSNQFQTMIQNGRNTLLNSFGTKVEVYSLGQLTFDAARFGAQSATGGPP